MKILYDKVSSDYLYPLSKKDISKIKKIIPSEIIDKISVIRFGCNRKTTQEGRIVKRGSVYDIRINFCLKNMKSVLISDKRKYIEEIRKFGGVTDSESGSVSWKLSGAKRYAFYILLHEIGHIVFCEDYCGGQMDSRKNLVSEEMWCDDYSMQLIKKYL